MWISSNLTSAWNLKFKNKKNECQYIWNNVGGVQVENLDTKEGDENYEIQKP
jgi:hypothetical protein